MYLAQAFNNMLSMSKGTTVILAIVGGIVGIVVLVLIMKAIYRYYENHYNYNILGGSLGMLVSAAGIVGFIFLKPTNALLSYVCIGVAVLMILLVLIINIKRCGAAGIFAIIWQTIFFVAALFMLLTSLIGVRWTDIDRDYRRRARRDRRRRERRENERAERNGYYGGDNDRGYY